MPPATSVEELAAQLAEQAELHRMQLAAIMTAAMGNTRASAAARIDRSSPYWTAAYGDVCRAVDREIDIREHHDLVMRTLEQHVAEWR